MKKPQPEDMANAVIRLYRARVVRRETHAALKAHRKEHRSCDGKNHETGPCYYLDAATHEWCEVCQGSQPLWEARRKAQIEASAALVSVLNMGKAAVEALDETRGGL